MSQIANRLITSLQKGFIDNQYETEEKLRTRFLTNDLENNISVLETIKNELSTCISFTFSVAFITESGLNELKSLFVDLLDKGVSGKLITSHYLAFNSPKIFKELLKIKCLEVRVSDSVGFHPKGYLFEHSNYKTLIMGSSNLTSYALKVNHEWNIKVSSLAEGEVINSVQNLINNTWNKATILSEQWIDKYELSYNAPRFSEPYTVIDTVKPYGEIVPNKMQKSALDGIAQVRDQGETRGLVVSATGTGKTYLAAFDVKNYQPKKVLFIAHREQILNQAMADFKRVLGQSPNDFGLYSGNNKDRDVQYIFATIQTLSRTNHLNKFDKEEFDYIIIDEVHKAGAESYLKVIDYFTPKFLLGMTATPERTDDVNIFKIFDFNIAYEIRLQEAIESDMLCNFHYFGVVDYEQEGEVIDETTNLARLVSNERVDHLINKVNYYGHNGQKVRGLIFTSRVEEAQELSELLNKRGYKTVWLSGSHSITEREEAIDRLERNEIEYIITVDIFNEGIDIPSINQVVMLRETKSSIIFTQQLGRGLRKFHDKEFVTIIDFIGNYKNNYLIPIALSGDTSLNKDEIRRKVVEVNYIKGVSSVNFEKIARDRIYESITNTKLDSIVNLKKEYFKLKNRIGRIPMLSDFYKYESVDPAVIAESRGSYYRFVSRYDEEFKEKFGLIKNNEALKALRLLTKEFINSKRAHEVVLLEYLINHSEITYSRLEQLYKENDMFFSKETINSVLSMYDLSFYHQGTVNTYQSFPIIKTFNSTISLSNEFTGLLENSTFKRFTCDIIDTVKVINSDKYEKSKMFKLNEIYTRKDASRLLQWDEDRASTIYGYMIHKKQCPIFVTYNKHEVESSVDYKDRFINTNTFRWYTKSNRTLKSHEVLNIINAVEKDITLHLFVKKDDATYAANFYYLGELTPIKNQWQEEVMADGKPVVRIDMKMETPITESFYNYLEDKE